jgi:hypothetical protein
MRTLSRVEIEQVSGGVDSINLGGASITGIEAGLALRNAMGAGAVAYGFGYAVGTGFNAGWETVSGDSLGTDVYQATHSW